MATVLTLIAASFLLYARLLSYPPVWDDHTFVQGQPFLRQPANLTLILGLKSFREPLPVRGAARPLWLASLLIDRALANGRFGIFRASNILWHGFAAASLLALVWQLTLSKKTALAAAALFLCHPVNSEAVSLVTNRADIMTSTFCILALCFYCKGRLASNRRAFWAASLTCFAAALLSKEMAAIFPLLVLLADYLFPVPRTSRAPFLVCCAVLTVLYIGFRTPRSGYRLEGTKDIFSVVQSRHPKIFTPFDSPSPRVSPHSSIPQVPPWLADYYADPEVRLRTSLSILADNVRLLLWPARLQADYAPRPPRRWLSPAPVLGILALGLMLGAAWTLRHRQPLASFGLLWTFATLLPVSGIFLLRNLEAERYLYFPGAGVCMAAACGLRALWSRGSRGQTGALALGASLTLLGAARIGMRLPDFSSDIALHEATVKNDPSVPRAHLALAEAYTDSNRLDFARSHLCQALDLWPDYHKAAIALAQLEGGCLRPIRPTPQVLSPDF